MLVVARLRPGPDEETFRAGIKSAITALAARPGHIQTRLGRALDDEAVWVLVSEWDNVGSYRRALSSYDVRMASGVLMTAVVSEPSAFEVIDSI